MPTAKLRWGYPRRFLFLSNCCPQMSPETKVVLGLRARFSEQMTDMATIFYVKE